MNRNTLLTGLALLLVSCSNPVGRFVSSDMPRNTFAVAVVWGEEGSRSLSDDAAVSTVSVQVENSSGASIGTGSLSKVGAAWKGTLSVSETGSATFWAVARSIGGKLLYNGRQVHTLSGVGDSVSIAVQALSLLSGGVQGQPLSLAGKVSTFAGAKSQFRYPTAVTGDGTNLYVADTDNHIIRKIVLSTGAVSTFAGQAGVSGSSDGVGSAARFNTPQGIATDGTNLYVADSYNSSIRKIVISTGTVTTFAGTVGGYLDATGTSAKFQSPQGLVVVGSTLYVTDAGFSNNHVRAVDLSNQAVTTVAGFTSSGSAEGTGTDARFYSPWGIASDGTNLFVADTYNNKIRQIVIATKVVTTLAGSGTWGFTNGTGSGATFASPTGVATDGTYLYVADSENQKIRKVAISDGATTTFAGSFSGSDDGTGASARFYYPKGIARVGTDFYVVESSGSRIRKVTSSAVVTTVAGLQAGMADGPGLPEFNRMEHLTTDGINLFAADSEAQVIRSINLATGISTVFAGTPWVSGSSDGTGTAARFYEPQGITTDGTNLYVADSYNHVIRQIVIASGVVTTLAGSAGLFGYLDGQGTSARFAYPAALTTDGTNLYVADDSYDAIRRVVIATGVVTTVAGQGFGINSTGTGTIINNPWGLATDGTNLYVTDRSTRTIRKIVLATGEVTIFAGTDDTYGSTDGIGSAALFAQPHGIVCDGTSLFVTDRGNYNLRQIVLATGAITTLAGPTDGSYGEADGIGTAARFYTPVGITTDGISLYINDMSNHTIRKVR